MSALVKIYVDFKLYGNQIGRLGRTILQVPALIQINRFVKILHNAFIENVTGFDHIRHGYGVPANDAFLRIQDGDFFITNGQETLHTPLYK